MDKIIFIPTVQHTGTWFLIDLLRLSPRVNQEVVEFHNLQNRSQTLNYNGKWNIVHTHVGFSQTIELNKHPHHAIIAAMITEYGATVPLRDPLRSLITRHARHPSIGSSHIVRGFEFLAEMFNRKSTKMLFVPIDLPIRDRQSRLWETSPILSRFQDVVWTSEMCEYVRKWEAPAYNVTLPELTAPLAKAYDKGNIENIKRVIPKAVAQLQESVGVKKFLSTQGYKELIW